MTKEQSVVEAAANVVRKWNFMACSDADGLVADILAISMPDQWQLVARDILDADKTTGSLHMNNQNAWAHSMSVFLNKRLTKGG